MAVSIKEDGNWEIIYGGPYKGVDVQMPQNLLDPSEAALCSNWILRNATLQSRPRFIPWTVDLGGTNPLTGVGTFLSPAGFYHTFATDSIGNLYNLNGSTNTLSLVFNFSHLTGTNPLQWRVINSTSNTFPNLSGLYMVNGAQTVCFWDGTDGSGGGGTGPRQDVVVVAGTTIGAKYIGVLAQHAILANTIGIANTDGKFTIRWSAVGLPTVFDPAVNINAGFNILIDFADEITGMMFLGRVAYIFHRTGITEMAPTGVGTLPFDFNHIWNAQDGTGSIYPYTIAQYGQVGAFASTENIYMVQNYQFQPIGGQARDAIYADIHASLQQIGSNQLMGTIAPAYNDNFVYTVYQLYIPLGVNGPTVVWQYSIESGYWERLVLTGERVTGIPTFCLTK